MPLGPSGSGSGSTGRSHRLKRQPAGLRALRTGDPSAQALLGPGWRDDDGYASGGIRCIQLTKNLTTVQAELRPEGGSPGAQGGVQKVFSVLVRRVDQW